MRKLPSLTTLWHNTRSVVIRFPIPFLISVFAVIIWWLAINSATGNQILSFYKLLALSNLAFCLTLAGDLFSESKTLSIGKRWSLHLLSLAFCTLLFFILSPEWFDADIYKLATFIIAGHLLVSFLPFSSKKHIHSFWQYNKFLFLRFLTATLYSGVLYLGLVIALSSIKNLFNVDINGDIYFSLFAFIAAGFNTLFFLAGIPTNLNYFEQDSSYPKGLKVFTQYVLIPLLTIYLAILLVYEFKIVIDQKLPEGMVSILIMGYATLGILSYLLIYPIRNEKDNEWTKTFSKLFFIFMIPLLILLCVAVWVRVSDYAFTEPRYFLVLLTVWLSGITLYFLVNKSPNIQIIPISLCILALFSTFGPQSSSSIAKNSQLTRYKQLGNDTKSEEEKGSIIRYMVRNHGLNSLQTLTSIDLTSIQNNLTKETYTTDSIPVFKTKEKLIDTAYSILNVKPQFGNSFLNFYHIELADKAIDISGYDYIIDIQSHSTINEKLDSLETIKVEYLNKEKQIKIQLKNNDSTIVDLSPFYGSLKKDITNPQGDSFKMNNNNILIPDSMLRLNADATHYSFSFVFKNITISKEPSSSDNNWDNSFNGVLLIRKKDWK